MIHVGVHRRTGKSTVIKESREDRAPLARERAALLRVQGPGVVGLLDVYGDEAIALEHVRGPSLAERIARRPLSARELAVLAKRLLEILARISAAGLVHGDLKPDNVLLPRGALDGAVVIDFETATEIGAPTSPRVTAAYVAPERLIGQGSADARSDLFSLGALLVAAATGSSPFEAETRDATLLRVLAHEAPSPAGVPASLAAQIAKMLAKQPEARTLDAWPSRRNAGRARAPSARHAQPELHDLMTTIERASPGERIALQGPDAKAALDAVTTRFARTGALLAAASASAEPWGSLLPDVRRRLGVRERAPLGEVARALGKRGRRHALAIAELIGSPLGARHGLDGDALARARQDAILFVLGRDEPRSRAVITVAAGVDHASKKALAALLQNTRDAVVVLEQGALAEPATTVSVGGRGPAAPASDALLTQVALWSVPFEREDLAGTLVGATPEQVDHALHEWTAAGVIVPDPFGATWRFADASAREALVASLEPGVVQAASARIGAWIAAQHPRAYSTIARYFAAARQPLRAAYYAWRAASAAQEGGDTEHAGELLELASAQLRTVTGSVHALLSGLLDVVRAQVLRWQGKHAEASTAARRALSSLPVGSAAWCEALGERATAAGKLGDPNEVSAVAAALRAEPSSEAAIAWDRACSRTAVQLFHHGRQAEARALVSLFRERTTNAHGKPDARRRGLSPGGLAYECLYDGRHDEHVRLLEQSAIAFDELGDERTSILYGSAVGFAYAQLGDYARAERVLVKTRARASVSGAPTLVTLVDHNLGEVLAHRRGKLGQAIAVESAAILELRAQGDVRFLAASLAYRARMHLAAGDLGAAEADAREAVERGGAVGSLVPIVFATLAEVLLEKSDATEALASASKAYAALAGGAPVEAGESLARLVFARATAAHGDAKAARELAREAWRRLRAQAATFTPRSMRRTFLDGISEHRALRRLAEAR